MSNGDEQSFFWSLLIFHPLFVAVIKHMVVLSLPPPSLSVYDLNKISAVCQVRNMTGAAKVM